MGQDQMAEHAPRPGQHAAPADAPAPAMLPSWRYAADAWAWSRRLSRRYVDIAFRLRSARIVPASGRARLHALGLPPEVIDATLGAIRRVAHWPDQWIATAQRYLGEYRRQVSAGNLPEAAQAQAYAALCYHVAQLLALDDPRTVRQCRAAAASLFTRSLPYLHPNVRHIHIPWRSRALPAYLRTPEPLTRPVGIVVLLNGASTAKEETFGWSDRFIEQGFAVLALDSPGTGEATGIGEVEADHDDVLDGVFDLFANEPLFDLRRVAAVGVSIGGNQAVRCAAYDRRIMAAVAVTPPYDPARWIHRASPLLHQHLGLPEGALDDPRSSERITAFSLPAAANSRQPLLIFGAGRDLIVPPSEAQLLAHRVGPRATLVWQPNAGHGLYELIDAWTFEAATWLGAVAAAREQPELRGDPAGIAQHARETLKATPYTPRQDAESTVDVTEYARIVSRPATAQPADTRHNNDR